MTLSRREFLASLVAAPLLVPALAASASPALVGLSRKSQRVIAGSFVEDDSAIGHRLRDGVAFNSSREERRAAVAIVGGGMGGLSAGWRLDALGIHDWMLLELAHEPGGNARSGQNDVTRFPWGAHYVPVPGKHATHVRALFRELGLLDANGQWDERTLCHSPQERLWQHGRWQEGLEPTDGLTRAEREQFARFDKMIEDWRATGVFRVPMGDASSVASAGTRRALQQLDSQTAHDWMTSAGFNAKALRWWVEYGMRDDYGASLSNVSAWAAVQYFSARDAEEQGPLTWPEGNNWIVRQLASRAGARIITEAPAWRIEPRGRRWLVRTPRVDVLADAVIWAAPLFVLPHVVSGVRVPVATEHAPWVVANLTLDHWPAERGAPPAWDNVIYDSPSLGYVVATHQALGEIGPRTVFTWYHAVADRTAQDGRKWLQQRTWSDWRDYILADLARAHPDIAECVTRIDVRRYGHAMARPVPGVLSRVQQLGAWRPAPNMFVAHADMSGLSLFEEAQWQGVRAAEQVGRVLRG